SRTELPKQSSSSVTEQESIGRPQKSLSNRGCRLKRPAAPAPHQLARYRVRRRELKFLSTFFGTNSGEGNYSCESQQREQAESLRIIGIPARILEVMGQLGLHNGCVRCK